MSDTKNNVTINKEYDGNLKKIKPESSLFTFLCSPIGCAFTLFLFVTIGVLLLYLGEEYYMSIGYNGKDAFLAVLKQIMKSTAILLCVIILYCNIFDLKRYFKTFKYAKRLPKTNIDFERLGIPTFGDYVEYILTNLFVYESHSDFVVQPICMFLSDNDLKDSLLAAIAYYNSIDKLVITKDNIKPVYINGDKTYVKCTPEFAVLRPAFIIESYSRYLDFPDRIKIYVDKNRNVHIVYLPNKGGPAFYDESEYGLIDSNVSEFNGNHFYGFHTKKTDLTCKCYDGSIFNSKTCEFITDSDVKAFSKHLSLLIIPFILYTLLKGSL